MELELVQRVSRWAAHRARWRGFRAAALYVLLALVVGWRGLVGSGTIGPDAELDEDKLFRIRNASSFLKTSDLTPIILDQPRDLLFARGLHAGRIDTWNPLSSCGAPLWAEQGGPFPLKLPFYIWPHFRAYNWFRALRLIVAGLGGWFLARRRGVSDEAALGAGALFEISGALIGHAPFAGTSATCLLPWAVSAADAIGRSGGRAAVACGALILGLAGWGGHPEIDVLVYLGFGGAVLGHMLGDPRESPRILLRSAAAVVLGVTLSAPALLPLAELSQVGQSYKSAVKGEQIWEMDLRIYNDSLASALFAPNLLLSMRDKLGRWFPYMFAPSIGTGALVLAVAGLSSGGLDLPLLFPALLGIGLSTAVFGLGWLHLVPVLKFILPQYGWPLVILPLTQSAGRGLDALSTRRGIVRLLVALALTTAACALVWAIPTGPESRAALGHLGRRALETAAGQARLFGPPLAMLLAALLCFVAARRWAYAGALIAGATAVSEAALTMSSYLTDPASVVLRSPPSPAVRFLQNRLAGGDARLLGVPFRMGMPNSPLLFGLPDFRSTSAIPVRRFMDYKNLIDSAAGSGTYHTVDVALSPLLDLAGVRYVVTPRFAPPTLLDRDPEGVLVYRDAEVRITENRAAVPRVWITHRVKVVHDEREAVQALSRTLLQPSKRHAKDMGLLDLVFLEPGRERHVPAELDGEPWTPDERARLVDSRDPDRVEIAVDLKSPGIVVLADTYYPGWRATVDGLEAPIYPADVLFRAVPVPEGHHSVEFEYRSPALHLGVAIALAALLVCALLLVGKPSFGPSPERLLSPTRTTET